MYLPVADLLVLDSQLFCTGMGTKTSPLHGTVPATVIYGSKVRKPGPQLVDGRVVVGSEGVLRGLPTKHPNGQPGRGPTAIGILGVT